MVVVGSVASASSEVDAKAQWWPRSSVYETVGDRSVSPVDVLLIEETRWACSKLGFLDERQALVFAREPSLGELPTGCPRRGTERCTSWRRS